MWRLVIHSSMTRNNSVEPVSVNSLGLKLNKGIGFGLEKRAGNDALMEVVTKRETAKALI